MINLLKTYKTETLGRDLTLMLHLANKAYCNEIKWGKNKDEYEMTFASVGL